MKTRSQTERLLLLKRKIMPDRQGGYEEAWQELGLYWAALKSASPTFEKKFTQGTLLGTRLPRPTLYKVTARFGFPTLFERFKWRGQLFAVVSEIEEKRRAGEVSFYAVALNEENHQRVEAALPPQEEDSNV